MLGAIEAGGTKFVCAVSDDQLNIIERHTIKTTTPEETMPQVIDFFKQYDVEAIGVGSFGPIDINEASDTYGYITQSPKLAWQNYNFVGALKKEFNIPIGWNTDVNVAALSESTLGAAKGTNSSIYITVGTGVGGGAMINGEMLQGFGHPEMGHMLLQKHPDDEFEGNCPYHKSCLEGLAAGPAIEKRYGVKGDQLAEHDDVWEIQAYYLAQAIVNLSLIISPERIVLGGGVMKQEQLFPLIKEEVSKQMNNYMALPDLDNYIVSPGLGDNAGITGGLLLAQAQIK